MYTVKVTVNRSYKMVGGEEYPITVEQKVYVSGTQVANAPDLSGFKDSINNSYVYYVMYSSTNQDGTVGYRVSMDSSGNIGYTANGTFYSGTPSGWYDYNDDKYANLLISSSELNYGTPCTNGGLGKSQNAVMLVWIPRYQFKVDNNSQVLWVSGTGNASATGYQIPDGFNFAGKALERNLGWKI